MTMTFSSAVLAKVTSETRPDVAHEIRMGADGNVYCTCEAWKYQRLPVAQRTCKHLQAFARQANLPALIQVQETAPKAPRVSRPRKSSAGTTCETMM
jgi:hypothetical protein